MTKNMGTADRVIRILAAMAIAALYLTSSISGIVAIGLGVVAVVFQRDGAVAGAVPLDCCARRPRHRQEITRQRMTTWPNCGSA